MIKLFSKILFIYNLFKFLKSVCLQIEVTTEIKNNSLPVDLMKCTVLHMRVISWRIYLLIQKEKKIACF